MPGITEVSNTHIFYRSPNFFFSFSFFLAMSIFLSFHVLFRSFIGLFPTYLPVKNDDKNQDDDLLSNVKKQANSYLRFIL